MTRTSLTALLFLTFVGTPACTGGEATPPSETAANAPPAAEGLPPIETAPAPPAENPVFEPEPDTPAPVGTLPAPAPEGLGSPAPSAPVPEAPASVWRTVPAGQTLQLVFDEGVSSGEAQVGDRFTTRVAEDVVVNGEVLIPSGSTVSGSVTEATALNKRVGGQARLGLAFESLRLPDGSEAAVRASFSRIGKSETKKDAATIAGSAAAGALLGRILGKDDKTKGTLVGAAVGAATGTAIATRTDGEVVALPAGTTVAVNLEDSVQVPLIR